MACNVLIVDASKLARLTVARLIKQLRPDWTVTEARDADDALKAMSSGRPDIALVDYNMPGREGLSLTFELRLLVPNMPFAVLTAHLQTEIVEHAHALGATFLPKPLTDTMLAEFLANAEARL
jgi:DNA-binding NarL/FixJ family response regulator